MYLAGAGFALVGSWEIAIACRHVCRLACPSRVPYHATDPLVDSTPSRAPSHGAVAAAIEDAHNDRHLLEAMAFGRAASSTSYAEEVAATSCPWILISRAGAGDYLDPWTARDGTYHPRRLCWASAAVVGIARARSYRSRGREVCGLAGFWDATGLYLSSDSSSVLGAICRRRLRNHRRGA